MISGLDSKISSFNPCVKISEPDTFPFSSRRSKIYASAQQKTEKKALEQVTASFRVSVSKVYISPNFVCIPEPDDQAACETEKVQSNILSNTNMIDKSTLCKRSAVRNEVTTKIL